MENQKKIQNYGVLVRNVLVEEMNYSEKEVGYIIDGYRPIIERIGYFEDPREWAERIDLALKRHITPEMWLHTLQ